jgi:competence protein ComEC
MEKMDWRFCPFIISCIFSLFWLDIPPFSVLIFTLSLSFWLFCYKKPLPASIAFGIGWFFLHAHWATSWTLPKQLVKTPLTVIGVVSDIPSHVDGNSRFNLQLHTIDDFTTPRLYQPLIKLNWQKPDKRIQMGDKLKLVVKLKPAHGFANAGGFSYQKYLLLKGIRATGYVISKHPVEVLKHSSSYRQQVFNTLVKTTNGLDYQGILLALVVGEKQLITKRQWQTIKAAGISHLLAISGLHIGIVFLFGSLLAKLLVKTYCYLFNKDHNVPFVALFFGLLAALGYSWLAGFSIPTVRAFLMLSLLVLTLSLKKSINARTVIVNTLTIILLFNPLAILEPGMWMSFIAVIVIITTFWWFPVLVKEKAGKFATYAQSVIKMQLALFVFLLPVTIMLFNGFSASGGFVNLVAVPWVSFITVPLALLATVIPIDALFTLADWSLAGLFLSLENPIVDGGWITVKHLPWYHWFMLMVFGLSLLVPVTRRIRSASLLLTAPFILSFVVSDNSLKVHVLDVGQGLSVIVEKNRHILVYDLGPIYKSGFNTVDHVLLPFLAHHGYDEADYLVISHADTDHLGAYDKFLDSIKANQVIAPQKILPTATVCEPISFEWQGLKVDVLWPSSKNGPPRNRNDSSCVIKISSGDFSVLLAGDISKRVEKQLIKTHATKLASTVLIAPHHGSKSSSSIEFVHAVKPDYVVYSTGFLNRYKFPRDAVVQRFKQVGAQQLNTANLGQVSFTFDGNAVLLQEARKDLLPHWYFNQ